MERLNYSGSMGLNRLDRDETDFLIALRVHLGPILNDSVLLKRSDACALYVAELLQYIDAPVFQSVIAGHLFEIGRQASANRHGHLYREFLSQENTKAARGIFSFFPDADLVKDDVIALISSMHRKDPFDRPEMRILRDAMRLIDRAEFVFKDAERTRAKLNTLMETEAGYRLICRLLKMNSSEIQ